ncbi:hypothetical protein ANCDUO_07573 [Ancylostoma duodenale]|uniref:Transporter, major facilitator family protein n=1 Tax=Ancylostoma duodenale TaxID=51022 RepID=A0A0C2CYN2_9BILA|nr:hypothetical protein ANCDUO_07573 [Ancylostoma duodenale]
MITLQFARTLFAFTFFGIFTDLQLALFSALPGPLTQLYNRTLFEHYGVVLSRTALSTVPTIVSISTAAGILFGIIWILPLIDSRGRKFVAVHVRCVLGIASCALQALAGWLESAELFIVGQLLLGISIPIEMVVVAIFVTECAPDKHRGFASVALHVGHVVASLIICCLLYLSTIGIHDSPKWLVTHGEKAKATSAVRFYHGTHENQDRVLASLCLETYLTTEKNMNIKAAWMDETIREAMKVIITIQLMFTLSPLPVERAYSVMSHTSLGLTVEQSLMLSWVSTLLLSPLAFLGTFAIDKFGRRPVVFVAAAILQLLEDAYDVYRATIGIPHIHFVDNNTTANEFASDLVYSTGAGAVASLLVAELVPPAARVAVAQVLLLVPLVSTVPIMASFPVLNTLFAPAIYVPLLICQPFIVLYLIRSTEIPTEMAMAWKI